MTVTEKEESVIESPIERRGLDITWYLIVIFIVFLMGRVAYLTVWKGEYYSDISRENRIRRLAIKAPRGNILDKYGKILARNIPSLDAVIIPSEFSSSFDEKKKAVDILSSVLELNRGNVEALVSGQDKESAEPVLLKENITQDQALLLVERGKDLRGIAIEKTAIRNYEDGMIFSHIVGYDGKITKEEIIKNEGYLLTDYIGKTGIEKSYERELHGKHGAKQTEIDSLGNMKKDLGVIEPQSGSDLILNIDEGLQKKLYDSLVSVLEKTETNTAAAVAIDPRNGGVLAMVSLPSFDNNLFARGISNEDYKNLVADNDLPLLNRAIGGEYPPGSTLKPAVAAAAMSEGIIDEGTTVNCSGSIHVGSWRFGDWKTHGLTDVRKAIAESCDVFFYSVGGGYGNISGLGMSKMKKYETLFGFGSLTGIDLAGEREGFIPSEEWKLSKIKEKWYVGDNYNSSIGQGFITATPLQLVNYTAAIANGGTLYKPRIVNRIKKVNGQEEKILPDIIRNKFISSDVMRVVREGMRQTVVSGTAQQLKNLPVEVAGKTGTAQFGTENKTHAWFISFAPYSDPEIAMVVLAEGGGEGHSSSVPVTKEVYQWYFSR